MEERKCREERVNAGVFVSHLSPQEHAQVVRLLGSKCIVKCLLNGLETDALWYTGAQVSMISHSWLKQCLPGCNIRDIAGLLGIDGLELKAGNETNLPYEGWVKLLMLLKMTLTTPLQCFTGFIGYAYCWINVIEEITKHSDRGSSARVNGSLLDVIERAYFMFNWC